MATLIIDPGRTSLQELLERARQGDEIVVEQDGHEVVRMKVTAKSDATGERKRQLNIGWAKDRWKFVEGWDAPEPWDDLFEDQPPS